MEATFWPLYLSRMEASSHYNSQVCGSLFSTKPVMSEGTYIAITIENYVGVYITRIPVIYMYIITVTYGGHYIAIIQVRYRGEYKGNTPITYGGFYKAIKTVTNGGVYIAITPVSCGSN